MVSLFSPIILEDLAQLWTTPSEFSELLEHEEGTSPYFIVLEGLYDVLSEYERNSQHTEIENWAIVETLLFIHELILPYFLKITFCIINFLKNY